MVISFFFLSFLFGAQFTDRIEASVQTRPDWIPTSSACALSRIAFLCSLPAKASLVARRALVAAVARAPTCAGCWMACTAGAQPPKGAKGRAGQNPPPPPLLRGRRGRRKTREASKRHTYVPGGGKGSPRVLGPLALVSPGEVIALAAVGQNLLQS